MSSHAVSADEVKGGGGRYRIDPTGRLAGAWKIAAGFGLIGAIGAAIGFVQQHDRFAYSYLFALFSVLTIALGFLFFVIIQHLTGAGWSVTVRRVAEFFMSGLVIFPILAIPFLLSVKPLYPWLDGEHTTEETSNTSESGERKHGALDALEKSAHAATRGRPHADRRAMHGDPAYEEALEKAEQEEHAHLLHGKRGYLNPTFFYIRAVAYLAFWWWIATKLFGLSTEQDKSRKLENTVKAQKMAPISIVLFGLSVTFAGIDWTMALDPLWYSTMYGVYIFAAGVVAMFALLTLVMIGFKRSGLLGKALTIEHFHDLGKLTFGFLVFWAYIAFSQFFLIWYSNIPEELTFYHERWSGNGGAWKAISLSLFIVKFALPFIVLLSRNVKRRLPLLAIGATIIVVMHIIEMYWLVMPHFDGGALAVHWVDAACLMAVAGAYLAVVLRNMASYPLIPVGDPRLERALHFQNA